MKGRATSAARAVRPARVLPLRVQAALRALAGWILPTPVGHGRLSSMLHARARHQAESVHTRTRAHAGWAGPGTGV